MKITITLITLSIISTSLLFAQEDKGMPEIKYNQWEVGMDVMWIVKEYSPTVFFRKNTLRPKKNDFDVRNNAYRLSFHMQLEKELDFQLDTLTYPYYYHHYTERWNSFGFRLGYEWNKKVESLLIYYGSDIGFNYRGEVTNFINYMNTHKHRRHDISYSFNLIPFIGIKYKISKNILASAESNFIIGYGISKIKTDLPLDVPSINELFKRSVTLNYVPVSRVAISYLF